MRVCVSVSFLRGVCGEKGETECFKMSVCVRETARERERERERRRRGLEMPCYA